MLESPQDRAHKLQLRILNAIDKTAKTRGELCEELGVPPTTVWENLRKLVQDDFVESYMIKTKGRGRPKKKWRRKRESISLF